MFCCHRINTVKELQTIDSKYGIEIDLRDDLMGNIHLSHDPFIQGELFDDFLKFYNHSFIILNIKSERIEYKILEILEKYNITEYFFLDSSFPMIHKLTTQNIKKIAIRFSEFEGLDTIEKMKGQTEWVWVDCFTKNPLTKPIYQQIKSWNYKVCFVSPELQNQPEKIKEYRDFFEKENIVLDMICTKSYNIENWQSHKNQVQIIIPMSGMGKRFVDAGYKEPKPLIKVDGKPMIEHIIQLFPGEQNISFICNEMHLNETNMRTVLTEICPQGKIYKVPVEGREGPVHAVSLIFDHIDDAKEVIVSYCDYGTHWDYEAFLNDTRRRNADGAIACYTGFHPHMLGTDQYAFLKETELGSRWMEQIQEKKPFTNDRMNEYASNGTYYFKTGAILKKYFEKLMNSGVKINDEYYVSMVYNLIVCDKLNVSIFEIEHMLQWGTPNDLEIYKEWSEYFNKIMYPQEEYPDKLNTALILPMAGAGSRFSQKGYKDPKPLLKVCNEPMIIQAVNCLPKTTNKTFICLKDHSNDYQIENTLKTYYSNSNVVYVDKVTQGQACSCEIGIENTEIDLSNTPILISACDNGVYYNKEKYQKLLDDETVDVILWSFVNNPASKTNPQMYAWLETDEKDNVLSVSCKKMDPEIHNIKTSHVIIGTMFFRKASYFMDGLKRNYEDNIRTNGEFYVDDVINQCIKSKLNVKVFQVEHYICWGTPDDYESYLYWQRFFDKCNWHNYKYKGL